MTHVVIRDLNGSFIHIETDRDTLMALYDVFSFQSPNCQFHAAYKAGFWDGKIHLLDLNSGRMLRGLASTLIEHIKASGWTYAYSTPDQEPEIALEALQWLRGIDCGVVPDTGEKRVPHDFQERAVGLFAMKLNTLILSSTGSGKSLILYLALRWAIETMQAKKCLIVVPNKGLVEQIYKDFGEYSINNGWSNEVNCHRLYEGKEKQTNKQVLISTWQSLQNLPESYFHQFDAVFVDECHKAKANEIRRIMENAQCAYMRLGMTGTLDSNMTHKMVLEGLFGRPIRVSSTRDLAERGILAEATVICLRLAHSKEEVTETVGRFEPSSYVDPDTGRTVTKKPNPSKLTFEQELEYIQTSHVRNNYVAKITTGLEGNTLVLATKLEHIELLRGLCERHKKPGQEIHVITGDVKVEDRERIRLVANQRTDQIIIATWGTMSTGINIVNLNNLVFAAPMKAEITILQSIGRTLRRSITKATSRVVDVIDDISFGRKKKNYAVGQFFERYKHYTKERFALKQTSVNL